VRNMRRLNRSNIMLTLCLFEMRFYENISK